MGIKKVKYREKQKESNKRLMFSYEFMKEIEKLKVLKNNYRRNLKKGLEYLEALKVK